MINLPYPGKDIHACANINIIIYGTISYIKAVIIRLFSYNKHFWVTELKLLKGVDKLKNLGPLARRKICQRLEEINSPLTSAVSLPAVARAQAEKVRTLVIGCWWVFDVFITQHTTQDAEKKSYKYLVDITEN